ncbi:hypothetical protein R5W24_005117 [Gemmata sp. JC717]|uniref:hypothetical protein n=1 Tax=Gemmata algarum TaxID=2975278 RepID=UPI0021BB8E49|nr:hypothetical protein [Gemmata algarum]MDY3555970.1 hypothetical protein [Gemmata algarum]
MRRPIFCLLVLLSFALAGCGSKPSGSNDRTGGSPAKSAAAAKADLLATAEKMEGGMAAAVEEYVKAVEDGTWAWSTADDNFTKPGKFTPETVAAYKRWRAAKLAEPKK